MTSGASTGVDDMAAAAAAVGCLGALQRSLQGSLAAGVNGGIPTICRAFFPKEEEEETRPDYYSTTSFAASASSSSLEASAEDLALLLSALESFQQSCERAVEVHGVAARAAAATAAGSSAIDQMQGMFVRCLSEVKREIAAATGH